MTDRNGLTVRGESGRIGLAALLWSELWKTIANEQEETRRRVRGRSRISGVFIVIRRNIADLEKVLYETRAIRENHLFSKVYAKGKKFVGRRVIVYVLAGLFGRAYNEI